jgi:probable F420-dependent oxidoreductase
MARTTAEGVLMGDGEAKFGLPLFGVSPRFYGEIAKAAEDNGFESVWMPEHLVMPAEIPPTYLYSESGAPPISPDTPMYDVWVVLAYIAQATERIRLATNVFILPLRHPLIVARSVVTLDRLSNGRTTLGVGVGWLEDEFEFVGLDFHDRGARTDEMIEIIRRLFTEDVIDVHTEHYDFGPLKFQPKPRQRPLPIEVGGTTPPALRRAGRLGDGWIEIASRDLDEIAQRLGIVQGHRVEAGREHLPFEVTVSLPSGGGLDDVRRLLDLGATRIVAGGARSANASPEGVVDFVKRFADEVIAKV